MGVILRAHPVRGESHIQRNANGEVATREENWAIFLVAILSLQNQTLWSFVATYFSNIEEVPVMSI